MNDQEKKWIIANGKYEYASTPLLPLESRAVRYGDGCFETFRSYKGAFLELQDHIDRLEGALAYLKISSPLSLERKSLKDQVHSLLRKNNLANEEAVVRLQVWRNGNRGFAIPSNANAGYSISVSPLPDIARSVSLSTVATRRIPSQALDPRFKLSNSINYIRASAEAQAQGADDALMQTIDGKVSETTIANIFWFIDEKVFTPSESCDILPGITRKLLIKLMKEELGITCNEGTFQPSDIYKAECAWICNSVREIVPIQQIDDHTLDRSHSFLDTIQQTFNTVRNNLLLK